MFGSCSVCNLSSVHLVLFSRTENFKICYKAYYQEAKDILYPNRKTRNFTFRMQDTNFWGPCCEKIGYWVPHLSPHMSGRLPTASVSLLGTHSSKQSFSFASFETKQFPPKYGFRYQIGNSTKQTEMFCFKYPSHLFTLRNKFAFRAHN